MTSIIKLTKINHNNDCKPTEEILFNIEKLITSEETERGTLIRHQASLVDRFYCKETIKEIQELIK